MQRWFWFLLSIFILFNPPLSQAQGMAPEDTVKTLYDSYGIGPNSGKKGLDERTATRLFEPSLTKLYVRAVKSGAMGGDFFVQGQDFSLTKPVEITAVSVKGRQATIAATLTQDDFRSNSKSIRQDQFKFVLRKEKSGWLIHDAFSHGDSFTSELAAVVKQGEVIK